MINVPERACSSSQWQCRRLWKTTFRTELTLLQGVTVRGLRASCHALGPENKKEKTFKIAIIDSPLQSASPLINVLLKQFEKLNLFSLVFIKEKKGEVILNRD